jgi:hypothetical protein
MQGTALLECGEPIGEGCADAQRFHGWDSTRSAVEVRFQGFTTNEFERYEGQSIVGDTGVEYTGDYAVFDSLAEPSGS